MYFQLEITGTYSQLGDTAIDELVVTPKPCVATALDCKFEKDICQWKQSQSDKFDWTRRKGATPNSRTGPRESSTGPEGTIRFHLFL